MKVATDFPFSSFGALTGDAGSRLKNFVRPAGSPCNQISNLSNCSIARLTRLVLGKYRRLQIEACTQPRKISVPDPGRALYKGVKCLGGLPSLQGINRLKLKDLSSNWYSSKGEDQPVTEQYPVQYRSRLTVPDG